MSFVFFVTRACVARAYPWPRQDGVLAPPRVGARIKSAHDDGGRAARCFRFGLVAMAVLLGPVVARADDVPLTADQMALATQVVQAFGIQQVADAAMGGLRIVLVQSLAARNKQPQDKVAGIVDQILVPDLQALEPQFVASVADSYGHAFTTDELQQILAFYQTPTGVKLAMLIPSLTQAMVVAGHAWIERSAAQVLTADATKLTAQGLSTQ
jgi:hypothetical protein